MKTKNNFFAAGVLSYVLWGFLPIILKLLKNFNSFDIVFYRMVLASLFLMIFFVVKKQNVLAMCKTLYKKSKKQFAAMVIFNILGGSFLTSTWLTYVYVVQNVNVHTAAVGYLILPITTAFLALFILKEKISKLQWCAILISSVSCYLMSHVGIREILYILSIALSFGFYLISQRKNIYTNSIFNLTVQMIVGVIILYFVIPTKPSIVHFDLFFWFHLSSVAIFFTIVPLLCNVHALRGMNTAGLSFLGYINPIISFMIGLLLYNEKIDKIKLIAYCLLGIALVVFNWKIIWQLFESRNKTLLQKDMCVSVEEQS